MDIIDKRKQTILKALVTDYVSTCEPVASKRLVSFYNFDVRSATIRSEMNELASMGFLVQPHKSGGRIPTDLGYRFYVDNLMEKLNLDSKIIEIISKALKNKAEIEALIKSATNMLSDITGFVSVASFPKINNSKLKYVSISDYSSQKKLFVLAFSNGYIIHKIIDFSFKNKLYSIDKAMQHIYDLFLDREVDYIINHSSNNNIYKDIIDEIKNIISEYYKDFNNNTEYLYEGVGKILKYPEFTDLTKLQSMLSALENKELLEDIFKYTTENVTVKIGSENSNPFMSNYSLVSSYYKVCGIPAGVIGIIGPTRMDYSIAISGVEVITTNLSDMLTNLAL